jgi:eukaryotic-like serine/threonine-protein kinase
MADEDDITRLSAPSGDAPTVIGRKAAVEVEGYEILEKLGEGGFGVVYRARQTQPIARDVALKVLRPGMESDEVEARFRRERQALAVMDHPGIAKVYEAGRTGDGRPYFVMELIDGVPIGVHAVSAKLGLRERLHLFASVCDAVQHAHSKGVIHRDLKPGNILVTERQGAPQPVVIDFGVAKATANADWSRSFVTIDAALLGTPAYMSPEQLSGTMDVDTRGDVYSLGAVLYELLTGSRIIDLGGPPRTLEEIVRLTTEHVPPRPSTRVAQSVLAPSPQRPAGLTAAALARALRGDLDWIVMKAIEKDRNRRYATAAALGDDVERYLANQPVAARPPSPAYLIARFARRHRAGIIAAAAVLVALVAGTVGTAIGLVRASAARTAEIREREEAVRQRDEAQRNEAIARSINAFLNDDILGAVSPEALGFDVSLRAALDAAAERVGARFASQPEVEISLNLTIARSYNRLGVIESGARHVERAVARAAECLPESAPLRLAVMQELAETRLRQSRYDEALALFEDVRRRRSESFGPDDEDALACEYGAVACKSELGDDATAERRLRPMIDRARAKLGASHRLTLQAERGLGLILRAMGRTSEARQIFEATLEKTLQSLGDSDVVTFQLLNDLSVIALSEKRLEDAESLLERGTAARKRRFGEEHPLTLLNQMRSAELAVARGQLDSAEKMLAHASQQMQKSVGRTHVLSQTILQYLTFVRASSGKGETAESDLRAYVKILEEDGVAATRRAEALDLLAKIVASAGRAQEAAELEQRARALRPPQR